MGRDKFITIFTLNIMIIIKEISNFYMMTAVLMFTEISICS